VSLVDLSKRSLPGRGIGHTFDQSGIRSIPPPLITVHRCLQDSSGRLQAVAGTAQKISEISGGDSGVFLPNPPHGFEPREEFHDLDQNTAANPARQQLHGRHIMKPGTARPVTATVVGLGAITAFHGTVGLIAGVVVTFLTCAATVIRAAIHEWYRLRALREPGRQMQWLITHTPSTEEAGKLSALLFAAHAATMSALAAPPTDSQVHAQPSQHPLPGSATPSSPGAHATGWPSS
jgi:hypothetical protein